MDTFFIKPTDPASRPRDPETGECREMRNMERY